MKFGFTLVRTKYRLCSAIQNDLLFSFFSVDSTNSSISSKQQGQQPLLQNTVPLKLEGYLADINENQFTKKRFPWSSPDYDFCILQFCSSLEASIVAASEREFRVRNKLMAVGEIKNWDSFISSFLPIIDCKIDSSIIGWIFER